ncbi:ATP-binding protein [Streptomyces diastatochromogenes]|uniref:Histidine kinase/HSP90-like ATPase domain-containing protein n=1 Tax=Streptomyces diastatochromogenes TaxID=42236 RepID=A0A233SFH2_STRDA|nr:ATP-binding protein [Streptomyces diastatochromogenes]MCZ0989523.1 ATP-binding protein [Streptomyces diastatochromogenes]OXY94395.1 hypothetical protein BEK98_20440 [Streptomyces diastatochromogenes]
MTMTAEPPPQGHPGYNITMGAEPKSVAQARHLARQSCTAWGFDAETGETAALLTSELVTNAVLHGRSHSIRVQVARVDGDLVRIVVVDKSHRMPEMKHPDPEDVSGRGLLLVDALTDRWGTDLLPWGKRMWAEILIKKQSEQ